MPLDELNDQLHGRDFHADRTRSTDTYQPGGTSVNPDQVSQFQKTERWNEGSLPPKVEVTLPAPVKAVLLPDDHTKRRRTLLAWALGSVACMLLIGGIVMKLRSGLFSEENITVNLAGSGEVGSAELVTYDFEYANANWMSLRDTVVIFEYPEAFHPEPAAKLSIKTSRAELPLGEIASQGHGKVSLTGKFYGSKGQQMKIAATLRYTPSTITTTFEKRTERMMTIVSSPLNFEIDAPLERASDQEVQYDIRYVNPGDISFSNLKIKMDFPTDFIFTDADPKPSDGNTVWSVGDLAAHQSGTLTIRGRISGARDEQKSVHGGIGVFQGDGVFVPYGENSRKTRIVASPFSIHQTVNTRSNDVYANPGDALQYVIEYRNDGNVGIRDAIISMDIDSSYLDFSTLVFNSETTKGAYLQSRKAILWKASDLPALSRVEPGQSGKVSFTIKTYADLDKRGSVVRTPLIRSVAKIDSPDIPAIVGFTKVVASNTLDVKINSRVTGELLGYYQDTAIPNTGPIPPVIGQETTYTFHLSLANTTNDVRNARVSILLPTGNRFTGQKKPDSEKILLNERANELIWDMGTFAAGERREIVFQMGVTPEENAFDTEVTLVSSAIFTGQDSFTGANVRLEKSRKTSTLTEDSSIGSGNYRVRAANP